jgi:hypothetical protein
LKSRFRRKIGAAFHCSQKCGGGGRAYLGCDQSSSRFAYRRANVFHETIDVDRNKAAHLAVLPA